MFNYQSARWKKKRAHILKRDGYLCQYAKRYGRHVEATRVHHIYPSRDYPEYAWQDWNLISLSASAHELMHDRDTGELSKLGEKLKNKTIPPGQS